MAFSLDEIDRYERQVLLPEWGAAGQERVRGAGVVVSGAGAAARAAARYLAGAGVGRLSVHPSLRADLRALNPHVALTDQEAAPRTSGVAEGASDVNARFAVGLEGPHGVIRGDEDREAVGAALAVEMLKSILGLPHRIEVSLPRLLDEGVAS